MYLARLKSCSVLFVALCLAPIGFAQTNPEGPAIWREVTGIRATGAVQGDFDAVFQRPHIPSFRTTQDGRIGINVKGVPRITLIMPEKLDGSPDPFLHQPASSHTVSFDHGSSLSTGYVGGSQAAATAVYVDGTNWNLIHSCLWDDAPPVRNSDNEDVYSIKVLVTARYALGGASGSPTPNITSVRFFVTPLKITVSNPKTTNAVITGIKQSGLTVAGPILNDPNDTTRPFDGTAFEPTIVDDGRLIVFRVGSNNMPIIDPETGLTVPGGADVVYAHYTGGETVDPNGWSLVYPISHAFHDPALPKSLGFIQYQLRDPAGELIDDWEDLGGTYPWMDREAKNLFFTAIGSRLHEQDNWSVGRYPLRADPAFASHSEGTESNGKTRGPSFAGLWTRGKMVLMDNLLHDMDYAIGNTGAYQFQNPNRVGPQHRIVELYSDGGPYQDQGEILLAYGRSNWGPGLPEGENANTTILDSVENFHNYKSNMVPTSFRDVVWFAQNAKHTDQLEFDDYMDPDALIVCSMVGLMTFPQGAAATTAQNRLVYHDGWNDIGPLGGGQIWGTPATHPIRLQNGASSHHRWVPPAYGALDHGFAENGTEARIEPIASGGIAGRGLWLQGDIGLRFEIPDQTGAGAMETLSQRPTYLGMFVDCRFADDSTLRRLLTFPDGSSLDLLGRSRVVLNDSNGPVHFVDVPDSITSHGTSQIPDPYHFLPNKGWAHFALQIEPGGNQVTFLLNGLALSRWHDPNRSICQLTDGNGSNTDELIVGDPRGGFAGSSFRGWIDELKVLLHRVDPETVCNHAGGTLMGVDSQALPNSWTKRFSERYPAWAHAELDKELRSRGEAASGAYVNFHLYAEDNGVHTGSLLPDAESLAQAMKFPEGPLYHDAPRPDTTTNQFCISCHNSMEVQGLRMNALTFSGEDAVNDNRRQPLQPPAFLGGFIPANTINVGPAPGPTSNEPDGVLVDLWALETNGSTASNVTSAFIVAANSGTPLLELDEVNPTILEPALLGPGKFTFRGLLDQAQGNVNMTFAFPATPGIPSLALIQNVSHGPYTAFFRLTNPFHGRNFAAGLYTFSINPNGSPAKSYAINVLKNSPRKITSYLEGFQPGSPQPNWYYGWNAAGSINAPSEIAMFSWNATDAPVPGKYSSTGTNWPAGGTPSGYASLYSTGGWPGTQSGGGNADDRFALAGFQVGATGYMSLENLTVTLNNPNQGGTADGVDVRVHVQSNGVWSAAQFSGISTGATPMTGQATARFAVNIGDVVWVGIGPRNNAAFDHFALNYDLWFNEVSW